MSLDEVFHFCGLEGPEDTGSTHASIKEWASGKTGRSAVWHAGQVVRGTREIPAMHLRDFYAISLFHASLTFWAFGSALRIPNQDSLPVAPRQAVYLDREETSATYRYISLDRGTPVLHDPRQGAELVALRDSRTVMALMMTLMAQGDGEPTMLNSPLVENLLHVMGRVKDATGMANDLVL
jgi:hypothetical protein